MQEKEENDCLESYNSRQSQNQMMYGASAYVEVMEKKCHATQIVVRSVTMTLEMMM